LPSTARTPGTDLFSNEGAIWLSMSIINTNAS
jgi:hypothetical protein